MPRQPNVPRRVVLLVVVLAGLVMIAGIGVVAAGRGLDRSGGAGEGSYRGSEPPASIELPAFALTSYRGGRVASEEFRGRVVVLTLLDTQCTEACPILASAIARTVDRLTESERAQVRALAVTVDPAEDTPGSVRNFLRSQRAEGRLDYLIGEGRELRRLWTALHVLPSLDTGRDSLHSAPLRIYDRRGVWVTTLHAGVDLTVPNLLHDIRRALRTRAED